MDPETDRVCESCDNYSHGRHWCLLLDIPVPAWHDACWMWTPPGRGHSIHDAEAQA